MRVMVTGADGQLGMALRRRLPSTSCFLGRQALDVSDRDAVQRCVGELQPDIVINAAAWTAVDLAERYPEQAMAVNGAGPGWLARACASTGAALVHLSTDYVFDGALGRPYHRSDSVCPVNVYGVTKAEGERRVRESLLRHAIIRTSWVVSHDRPNFVSKIVALAGQRERLEVVDDQLGGLTPADALAEAVVALVHDLHGEPWGTWHVCGRPWASWCDVARAVVAELGVDVVVEPVSSSRWPAPAVRPADGRLDPSDFERRFGVMIDWRTHLPNLVRAWARASAR